MKAINEIKNKIFDNFINVIWFFRKFTSKDIISINSAVLHMSTLQKNIPTK